MAIGTEVPVTKPAVVGTIRIGTEVRSGVDRPPTASGKEKQGRGRARRCGAFGGVLLTSLAERFMEEAGEGFERCGALATRRIRRAGYPRGDAGIVGPPHVNDTAEHHESDQQELVK
jgi:hypothetical protein